MLRFLFCIVVMAVFGVTSDILPAGARPTELIYQLKQAPANVRSELHMGFQTIAKDCRELPGQFRWLWSRVDTQGRSMRADLRADTRHLTATISRGSGETR